MDSSSSSSSSATANLHGILKSLCFNTAWKYAVFWKLKHRARMVLTWEDGYYDNCEQHDSVENKGSCETIENLHGGRYLHDSLGSAVAKMSYHVYSLGEGIVGQAAVTGKHHWIFSDQHVTNSCSSFEFYDGWQSQFSAGIRTVAVVAVDPHGVVQLGSLNKVTEDMKLVTHIRDVFAALNDISVGHVSSTIQCSMENKLAVSDLPTMSLASEIIPNRWHNIGEVVNKEGPDIQLPKFPYVDKHNDGSYFYPFSGMQTKIGDGLVNKNKGIQISTPSSDGSAKKLQPKSNVINSDHQNQMGIQLTSDGMSKGESSGWKDLGVGSEENGTPFSINSVIDSINLCGVEQAEKFVVDHTYFPSNQFESVFGDQVKLECIDSYQNGMLHMPEISDMKFQKNLETWQNQTELNHLDPTDTSLKFSAVSELHVALGPAFLKKDVYTDREPENTVDGETVVMPEVMSSSHLMFDSGSENLLDAVVASVCHSCSDVKSERSFCKSVQSLLTTEKRPEPSSQSKKNTINSVVYSINQSSLVEEDAKQCVSSSGLCGGVAMSSKGFSSTCPSTCSEQLDRSLEPAKNNKKRARTGENGRPRPRDRQLIQDRIKELRELVPNGSKCSIDSLLERTIKHMLFLQSVTKHADKLSKCAESKMHQKGTGFQVSNSEQGSSWAVEVGSHLKVCSIIVENINKNGQMLVEMLCEECNHFLEIAEAIRSLGLMILKGVTEVHGDKTWICFVVEGQDNRIMHRMDVLWSLVQVLQTKTACS